MDLYLIKYASRVKGFKSCEVHIFPNINAKTAANTTPIIVPTIAQIDFAVNPSIRYITTTVVIITTNAAAKIGDTPL